MKAGKKNKMGFKGNLLLSVLVIAAALMPAITIVLLFGMLPTIAAAYADRSQEKMKAVTIGAMNLAGCTPFIIQIILQDLELEVALEIIMNFKNWLIMYGAAFAGYCIEWVVLSTASIFITEKKQLRVKTLEKQQRDLKQRWGDEVTGQEPLPEPDTAPKADK